MTAETPLLRPHAEQLYADELQALERIDDRPKPPQWRLSPWAVVTYVLGDGEQITPKYVGRRRLVELAVATRATDRALLLLGVPGTAKTWLSEHLAAALRLPGQWGPELSRKVLEAIPTHDANVKIAAYHLDPGLAEEAEALRDLGRRDVNELCDVLAIRAAILRELS